MRDPTMVENNDSHAKDLLNDALLMTASMACEENVIALLRQGLSLCVKILDCDRGMLLTEDENGERDILQYEGLDERDVPYSTTAINMVNEKNESLLISDTIGDQFLSAQESISRNDIRTVLCSRLDTVENLFQNKRVYLYCDSHTNRHPFGIKDLETFKLLSLLMANLVKKSELLEQKDAQIEELKTKVLQKQYEDLIFSSLVFEKCITMVKQGARTNVPVLLIGETGTGKEALAHIVHNVSPRKEKSFVAVNCGAIPSNLIESELFGHEKGAFTGAIGMKKGYFEEASGGTLFLDEVGELPLTVQPHFLRALQEGEITRVGSSKAIKIDVRIVAATNVDLGKAVEENKFRKDLYYRLNVLPVLVPSIKDRGEDALLLANYFLKKYCNEYNSPIMKFSRECEKAILMYDWPGNVREIQNIIQRIVITSSAVVINKEDLSLETHVSVKYSSLREAREAIDREMIDNALTRSPSNLTNAAKILGIDRKSLRLLLEKYGI